jgi:hypothetical protein
MYGSNKSELGGEKESSEPKKVKQPKKLKL